MIIDEIKEILENNDYNLDSDAILRIQTMLESIHDDNQINKLDYIIEWLIRKEKNQT